MSKPGDTPTHPDVQDLEDKPQAEDIGSRNRYDPDKKEKENQGPHAGRRIEKEIGAQNSGDRSARPDHRDAGVRTENDLEKGGSQAGQKIEKHKPERAQKILDIVTENP